MDLSQLHMRLVVADDNPDDRLLLKEAWHTIGVRDLHLVADGEELMTFLYRTETIPFTLYPRPQLILLDLKMPRKNGYEVLEELKADPNLRTIPVVVLTTSDAESDIERSYQLGACSYLTKPDSFDKLVDLVKTLHAYWFETVTLPD